MLSLFFTIFSRELKLYFRRRTDIFNSVLFFLLTIILFPIGVGPQPELMRELGYGVIWVAAIFGSLFGMRALFEDDYEDGTLKIYQSLPHSIEVIVFAKILANWVAYCLPIVLISPIAGIMFGLAPVEWFIIAVTLLLATPIFIMIGAIGAALSLGSKKGRIMLSLLVMPFYIPVLIFGVNISHIYLSDTADSINSSMMILGGLLLFSIPLSIWVSGFVMRED